MSTLYLHIKEWTSLQLFLFCVPIIHFSILCVIIKMTMESLSNLPVLTFPFNFTMIIWLTTLNSIPWLYTPSTSTTASDTSNFNYENYIESIDFEKSVEGVLNGFSQVYLIEDWVCGLFILFAMLIHDEEVAFLGVFGSLVGYGSAILCGLDLNNIYIGLYGFNR
eukprot:UN06136